MFRFVVLGVIFYFPMAGLNIKTKNRVSSNAIDAGSGSASPSVKAEGDKLLAELNNTMKKIQTLRGTTSWSITFVGDSLMYYQWQYLCRLLTEDNLFDPRDVDALWVPTTKQSDGGRTEIGTWRCIVPNLSLTLYADVWAIDGMDGNRRDSPYTHPENRVNATLKRLRDIGNTRLDIVYFNMGTTHVMHMHGLTDWSAGPQDFDASQRKADYFGNKNLEDRLKEDLTSYQSAGAWAVLPMTCNNICTDVMDGPRSPVTAWLVKNMQQYEERVFNKPADYETNETPFVACVDWIKKHDSELQARPFDALQELCYNTALTAVGSVFLAERTKIFVSEYQTTGTSFVRVVDAHQQTKDKCDVTRDGVHYHSLMPAILTEMMHSACGPDCDAKKDL